jgi:hypothetical protein
LFPSTSQPSLPLRSFELVAGPFLVESQAVALTSDFMAAGDVTGGANNGGIVYLYRREKDQWFPFLVLQEPTQPGSEFGFSVDMIGENLLVGATGVINQENITSVGAAYYFEFNRTSEQWARIGAPVSENLGTDAHRFAYSVGLSMQRRFVVGAPEASSDDATTGRIFPFEYRSQNSFSLTSEWTAMQEAPILGAQPGDLFGSAVDMSKDGRRIVVGAPGSFFGYIRVYEWFESQWQVIFNETGEELEEFGASVTFLSDIGSVFAVGAPQHGAGRGRIRVYQEVAHSQQFLRGRHRRRTQTTAELFTPLGQDVLGDTDQGIGERNTIAGNSELPNFAWIHAGTRLGQVRRFEFNSGTWEYQKITPLNVSSTEQPLLAVGSNDNDIVTASGGTVSIFRLDGLSSPSPFQQPTSPPSPTQLLTPAPVSLTFQPTSIVSLFPSIETLNSTTFPTVGPLTQIPTAMPLSASPSVSSSTIAPSASLIPSSVPTIQPTEVPKSWAVIGGPFFGPPSSGYGTAMGLSTTLLAAGIPNLNFGGVLMYRNSASSSNSNVWVESNPLTGPAEALSRFGAAVDVVDSQILVGAPGALGEASNGSFGAAFLFTVRTSDGAAIQVGSAMHGDSTDDELLGNFGAAVSLSTPVVSRVLVGAPGSNYGGLVLCGRVYTFARLGTTWLRLEQVPLVGRAAFDNYGVSVSMSRSGERFVVGSSGGYFDVYEWDSTATDWTFLFSSSDDSTNNSASFGSAVKMLNDDGTRFAVGDPTYDNDRGRIRVYQFFAAVPGELVTTPYVPLGPDIVGTSTGELLGSLNSLGGGSSGTDASTTTVSNPYVVVGTTQGVVRRYDFDYISEQWIISFPDIMAVAGVDGVAAVIGSSGNVAVGSGAVATIYQPQSG